MNRRLPLNVTALFLSAKGKGPEGSDSWNKKSQNTGYIQWELMARWQ